MDTWNNPVTEAEMIVFMEASRIEIAYLASLTATPLNT